MSYCSPSRFRTVVLLSLLGLSAASAEVSTLYLLNGTSIRGEIVDRSAKSIDLKTASGVVKVKTASLMPISRQQLKLPAEVEKEGAPPEIEAVLAQMEKILAENEALKQQVAALKAQLAKTAEATPVNLRSPAEGPTVK